MIYSPQYPKIPSFNIGSRWNSLFDPLRICIKNRDVVRIDIVQISIDNTF